MCDATNVAHSCFFAHQTIFIKAKLYKAFFCREDDKSFYSKKAGSEMLRIYKIKKSPPKKSEGTIFRKGQNLQL